ncbi:hypothetical protein ACPCXD_10625 [Rhodococcus sp. AB351]|uniref:hypothetical protein n=1 Tax=Rhodococcus sp. AB351 TaxID=3413280 RepID=UPI003C218C55
MNTTIYVAALPASLLHRNNAAQLAARLSRTGGCLLLADLKDERVRRGLHRHRTTATPGRKTTR